MALLKVIELLAESKKVRKMQHKLQLPKHQNPSVTYAPCM